MACALAPPGFAESRPYCPRPAVRGTPRSREPGLRVRRAGPGGGRGSSRSVPSTWRSIAAWAASGSPSAIAATIGSWLACETARARRGPGTTRSISAISTWICVSAATRRCEPEASATAMWKRASASRKPANPPTAALGRGRGVGHGLGARAARRARGERRGLARDGAAPVGQLAHRRARRRLAAQHERRRRIVAHERAAGAAAAGLDEPGLAQDLQRLAQRHRRDAELGGELDLAREALAGREHAGADRLAEAAHDLLDGALGLQRSERDVAGGRTHLNTITSR